MSRFKSSRPPSRFMFYDESGDTGTKFTKGSTKFFIASLLVVPRHRIKNLTKLITQVRAKHNYHSEIKYTKLKGEPVFELLDGMAKVRGIQAFSMIVDKKKYPGKSLTQEVKNTKEGKHRFSDFMTMVTIRKARQRLKSGLREAELVLDRIERHREDEFSNYIYDNLNKTSPVVGRITHVDSVYVPLVQLTDLVSGVVRDEVEVKKRKGKDHTKLWRIVKKFTGLYNIEREINLKKLKVE